MLFGIKSGLLSRFGLAFTGLKKPLTLLFKGGVGKNVGTGFKILLII